MAEEWVIERSSRPLQCVHHDVMHDHSIKLHPPLWGLWRLQGLIRPSQPRKPWPLRVFDKKLNGARTIDHIMITVISYIGILGAFLIAATVMYLGLVKIKLI